MIKTLLHFDSYDGEMNYDTTLKKYHCYNTKIKINKALQNIKEISLKSLEMPIFFNNIRSSNSSNLFSITFNYSIYNNVNIGISIPESNYNSISILLTSINDAITSTLTLYTGISIILSVVNTYYIKITHNCSSLILNKCILINNILGFDTGTYNTSITTKNFYCLNIDNYLNLYITNLSGADTTNVNGRLLSFKIPLNCITGNILYLGESNSFIQTISITDEFFVLSSMNIIVLDRFGFILDGGNSYFSFTLGINYDQPKERLLKYR